MGFRPAVLLAMLALALVSAYAARAGNTRSSACANKAYSYAGLESASKAHGVSATLVSTASPNVTDGHVAGWIGVGGANGRGGSQWLQAGFAAITDDRASRIYYEVLAGARSSFHELGADVKPGERHRFAVLEMAKRKSWWRVWVDGRPVSPPIHMPGSHGAWYPQAIAENFHGARGTCNGYAYAFSNLAVAGTGGGSWRPFESGHLFQDGGYRVLRGASSTQFLARSI